MGWDMWSAHVCTFSHWLWFIKTQICICICTVSWICLCFWCMHAFGLNPKHLSKATGVVSLCSSTYTSEKTLALIPVVWVHLRSLFDLRPPPASPLSRRKPANPAQLSSSDLLVWGFRPISGFQLLYNKNVHTALWSSGFIHKSCFITNNIVEAS